MQSAEKQRRPSVSERRLFHIAETSTGCFSRTFPTIARNYQSTVTVSRTIFLFCFAFCHRPGTRHRIRLMWPICRAPPPSALRR